MKTKSSHLMVALVILAAALGVYGLGYAALGAKSASVAALQIQIDTAATTAGRITSARAALAEIASDEATITSYFVPENGIVAFIDGLEARGKARGVSVDVLSVSANTGGKQHAFRLELSIAGSFDAVMRTVGSIEYAPYDITITKLSLVSQKPNGWLANLSLNVGSIAATSTSNTP